MLDNPIVKKNKKWGGGVHTSFQKKASLSRGRSFLTPPDILGDKALEHNNPILR